VILKELKVICFDALSKVLIIQDLQAIALERVLANPGLIFAFLRRQKENAATVLSQCRVCVLLPTAEYSRKWNETKGKVRHEVRFRNTAAILAFRRGDGTGKVHLSG